MDDADEEALFEAAKHASTAQLLLKAARLVDERALARLRAIPGGPAWRPAHTRLFPHLSRQGIRATTLAARLGVTKQAVAPLIADLVAWGMAEQVPDPSDGRARLVRWTERARMQMMHGLGLLGSLEAEWTAHMGEARAQGLREGLLALLQFLEDGLEFSDGAGPIGRDSGR